MDYDSSKIYSLRSGNPKRSHDHRFQRWLATSCPALASIVFALVLMMGELPAQNLPSLFANPQQQPSAVSEEELRTIGRAINDLKSGDLESRVGAAMLLGKYDHPGVMQALAAALEDQEVRVRRAALVSILEKRTPMFSLPLTEVMLPMLADPDPEIRRQISAILPRLTASWGMGGTWGVPKGTRQPYPENFDQIFIQAFSDPEVVVRRNIMEHPGIVPIGERLIPILLARLNDEDLQVRLLALREVAPRAESDEFLKKTSSNELGEHPLWDRELARQLAYHPDSQSLNLLNQLTQLPDRLTRLEAEITQMLLKRSEWESEPGFERLMQDSIPPETAQRSVRGLFRLERAEAAHLTALLMTAESGSVRLEALNIWMALQPDLPPKSSLKVLLDDNSRNIRQRTFQLLRSRPHLIPESLIKEMAVHPHVEVRELLLGLLNTLPGQLAGEVIFDLLIDNHLPIRLQAMQQAVRIETPGWPRILQASLRDPNVRVQLTAAELIIRTGESDGLNALRERMEIDPDAELAQQFRNRMPEGY